MKIIDFEHLNYAIIGQDLFDYLIENYIHINRIQYPYFTLDDFSPVLNLKNLYSLLRNYIEKLNYNLQKNYQNKTFEYDVDIKDFKFDYLEENDITRMIVLFIFKLIIDYLDMPRFDDYRNKTPNYYQIVFHLIGIFEKYFFNLTSCDFF